jgi:hypothetical protein
LAKRQKTKSKEKLQRESWAEKRKKKKGWRRRRAEKKKKKKVIRPKCMYWPKHTEIY